MAYELIGLCVVSGSVCAVALGAIAMFVALRVPWLGVRSNDTGLTIRSPFRTVFIPWSELNAIGWAIFPSIAVAPEAYYPAFFIQGRRLPVVVGIQHSDIAERLGTTPIEALHALETEANRLGVAFRKRVPNLTPDSLQTIFLLLVIGLPVVIMLGGVSICRLIG